MTEFGVGPFGDFAGLKMNSCKVLDRLGSVYVHARGIMPL